MLRLVLLVPVAIMLAACGSTPEPDAADATRPASATTNALAGTPVATYGHDLNRAKNVQDIVNGQAQQQAREIDGAASASSSQ